MVNVELQVNFVRCIGLQKNVQWLDGGALHQTTSNFSTSLHIVLTLWTGWKQTQMCKEAGCKMCREEAMCARCARCVQRVGANVQEGPGGCRWQMCEMCAGSRCKCARREGGRVQVANVRDV